MDPYLRKVYLSVAGILSLLWLGMLLWVFRSLAPEIVSLVSAPSPVLPQVTPLYDVPTLRFTIYRAVPGDTFAGLAQKFGLRETSLRSLNQANDETEPKPGALLTIPSKDGIFHMVRPGQSLADIARAYGLSLRQVLEFNHKRGDSDLSPGEILYLKGADYLTRKDLRWIALAALEKEKGFLKPTTGRFADGFGMRIHPITGKLEFHTGLDLAPGFGSRVVASQDGVVVFTGLRNGYGRLIIIDHGGELTSWYAHLSQILVNLHQKVKRGELIGKVGKSGRVTGPHLHFEIRHKGVPQNPLLYLVQ